MLPYRACSTFIDPAFSAGAIGPCLPFQQFLFFVLKVFLIII